jgi:nucleolin
MEKKDKKEKRENKEKPIENKKKEVVQDKENENQADKKSIFVSGLPFLATYDEIRNLFENCGEIISMKVPKFQDSGRNIGYAHIVYSNNESIEKVI